MVHNQQLLSFSLKGFIFITAGEHSVTCGKKRRSEARSNLETPKSPKGDLTERTNMKYSKQ